MRKRNVFALLLFFLSLACLSFSYCYTLRRPLGKLQLYATPRAPFRALVHNVKLLHGFEKGRRRDPGFWYHYEAGWYPIHVAADVFIDCQPPTPTLVVMSRLYRQTPQLNHSALVVEVVEEGRERHFPLRGAWENSGAYESVAIGRYALPAHASREAALACAGGAPPPVRLRLFYNVSIDYSSYLWEDAPDRPPASLDLGPSERYVNVTRSPEPPRSDFAMVAIFSFSHYLLPLWMNYWRLLGVDTFYLFYNGSPAHIPELQRELAAFESSVVVVSWQVIHWLTTQPDDITHGQPIAINSAFQRWRHLHRFMAFYDTDELLLTPSHDDLRHYLIAFRAAHGPAVVAYRSMCSWAMLTNLTQHGLADVTSVRLEHLAALPVQRGPAGGREKYILNVSAALEWGVRFINIHGVYSHQAPGPGNAVVLAPEGATPAYHLHLLNKATGDDSQKNDFREVFMPRQGEEISDHHLRDLIQRAIRRRLARRREGAGGW